MKALKAIPVGLVCTILVFALLLTAAWGLVGRLSATSEEEQLQLVYDAVRKALITCYATEGCYPDSSEHLVTYYGLAYDEERFRVVYDYDNPFGSPDIMANVMPYFRVERREAQSK